MDPNCNLGPPPRAKIPKDGLGPRGAPECYYTSRVLNSTFRYAHFIKKLRLLEDEMRRGIETKIKDLTDKQTLDFFTRCDRRSLINNVSQRVNLCMASYEMALEDKRKRLRDLLAVEEEANICKFVEEVQAGTEAIWQDKKTRLAYLLAKRKKEYDDRYNLTPLLKYPHGYRCILKLQSKEAQESQLYQIREKQMRKMADAETEKMWNDVSLKESEALAARMEVEEIERQRRNAECKLFRKHQCEQKKLQREQERELLKQEALQTNAMIENNKMIEAEEKRKYEEQRRELGREKKENVKERQEIVAKQQAEADLIEATWCSLDNQSLQQDKAKEDRRKQIERDLNVCNEKLAQMKDRIATIKNNNEPLILAEGQRIRDVADLKRCLYRKWSKQVQKDNAAAALQQATEKNKLEQDEQEKEAAKLEYWRSVDRQLDELVKHKELTEAQAKKLFQKDLLDQMAYNDLIKERTRQEHIDQRKKCQIATREYEDELRNMLSRPFFSDNVHPFMKRMASGLQMVKCECGPPGYCADPSPTPAPSVEGK